MRRLVAKADRRHGMIDGTEYVSVGEFGRTMRLLEEIRTDIKGDVSDLRIIVVDMRDAITARQDIANGRTLKNEIAVADAKLQVGAVQATVTHIDSHGCSNLRAHKSTLGALTAAGVVPDGRSWASTRRQFGISAGVVAVMVGLLELAKVVAAHFLK
jgi:hypothetical protein